MHAEVSDRVAPPRSAAATRARILEAANDLFYAHGIRATSADRIIEQVGITKVTFYRHFRTKSDLVVGYIQAQAAAESGWIESMRVEGDPIGSLRAIAAGIGTASCQPEFRGCAFINAAAEYSDPTDPVRVAIAAHRGWMLGFFAEIASESAVDDTATAAQQLMLLRDGAMVNGYLSDAADLGDVVGDAFVSAVTPRK